MAIPFLSGLRVHDSITLSDSKPIKWDTNNILSHNGTQTYLGDATSASVLTLNGGNATFAGHVALADSKEVQLGAGTDFIAFHNGSNTHLQNATGDLYVENLADDKDIIFRSDDGSGGFTEYFRLDGSNTNMVASKTILYNDNVKASFGNAEDLRILHNGTDSYIQNFTGTLQIQNQSDDKDILLRSDDGSGGIATYFYLDGSTVLNRFPVHARWDDSIEAQFGAGADLKIYHDGSNSVIADKGTGHLLLTSTTFRLRNDAQTEEIITADEDGAVKLYYDGSKKFETTAGGVVVTGTIDSSGTIVSTGGNIRVGSDTGKFLAGASNDLQIYHNGTNSFLSNYTGDLTIVNNADDKDIIFQSDNGSGGTQTYFIIDGSDLNVKVSREFRFYDSVKAVFGNSADLQIYHDGTNSVINNINGDLQIYNNADDKDIVFISDDGSGGTAEYFKLDGSDAVLRIHKRTIIDDNVKLDFGNGQDLQIYHDGANSYVSEVGTGNLILGGTAIRILNSALNEQMFRADEDDGVQLYFNNAVKFATTSTGATVTGDVTISSATPELFFIDTDNNVDAKFLTNNGNLGIFADTNNEHSSSTIYFNIDGSEKARFTSGGKLGIGTGSSLDEKLHVQGSVNNDDIAIKIENTFDDNGASSAPASALLFAAASNDGYIRLTGSPSDDATQHKFEIGSTASGSFITFKPSNSTALTLDSSQNATFAGNLEVNGGTNGITVDSAGHASVNLDRASTSYDNNLIYRTNGAITWRIWQDGSSDFLHIRDEANSSNMVSFQTGGNTTFNGTTTVDADLKVTGSGEDTFIIGPQTAGSGTILMSLNAAENAYEPLRLDVETFKVTASGGTSPCIIETSGLNTTFGGNVTLANTKRLIFADDKIKIGSNDTPGAQGIQIGYAATASGAQAIAFGYDSNATGNQSIAMGYNSTASGTYSQAYGYNVSATGTGTVVFGTSGSHSDADTLVASGLDLKVTGTGTSTFAGDISIGGTHTATSQVHIKNTSGDNRGLIVENTVAASYAELAIKSDTREFRLGTGGSGVSANATNLFYIYDATTGGTAGHRFEISSAGDVQARRTRSNTAGEVALSLQPTDSTIHYGFRIDQATNSFNLDRVDSAGQLLRVDASGNATFASGTITANGHSVWHAGNDGSGSGLDADFLDGIQGSQFLRSDADDTATGIINFTKKAHDYDTIPPNQNLLDLASIKIAGRNDIYGNATKTVITDYVAKYVNDNTGETTIRLYVDDNILVDGDTYMVSVYYENLIGALSVDFADTAITGNGTQTGTSSAPKSGRIYGYASRADYTSTYRFVDINLTQGSGHEVTLHSPKVEAGTTLTDFVATERTDIPTNSMHVRELIATSDATFAGAVEINGIGTWNTPSGGVAFNVDAFTDGYGVIRFRTNGNASKWDVGINNSNHFYIGNNGVNTAIEIEEVSSNATFAGQINAAGGSVGAPSIIFEGDDDTGFYHASSNAIDIATQGAHRVRINNTGVGIHTASPSTFLQVSGQGNRAGGNIQMGLSSQGANKWSFLTGTHYNSTTEPEGFALIGGYSDIDENRVVIGGDIWETNPSTSIHFWTHSSSTHAQGGSQKMVIKGDGNVGIGAASPSQKLHVVGTQIRLDNNGGGGGGYYLHDGSGTFRAALWDNGTDTRLFADGNGSTAAITIDSNNATFAGAVTVEGAGAASYGSLSLVSSDSFIRLNTTGGTTDKQKWDIRTISASGYEALEFRTVNDANNSFSTKLSIAHSGNATFAGDVQIDGSLTGAGSFVPVGGGTFTGDVTVSKDAAAITINSTNGTQGTLHIGRSTDTKAKITSGDTAASDLCLYTNGTRALTILSSQNATFAGDVTIGSGTSENRALNLQTNAEKNTVINLKESSVNYGFSIGYYGVANDFIIKRHDNSASGADVLTLYRENNNATFAGSIIGNDGITLGGSNKTLETLYNNTASYKGALGWSYLQMGNNGSNDIIGGNTAAGGYLRFFTNNTNFCGADVAPNGTLALTLAADGNATFAGTLTANGTLDVEAGALGGTTGNETTAAIFRAGRQNLVLKDTRTDTGTDWNNATFKIIAQIDSTNHQSIDFVNDNGFLEHIDIRTGNQVFHSRFTHDGKLGIGTASPNSILHLSSTGPTELLLSDTNAGSNLKNYGIYSDTGKLHIRRLTDAYSGYTPTITVDQSNVGIGTASPSAPVHIKSAVEGMLWLDSSGNTASLQFRDSGAVRGLMGFSNGSSIWTGADDHDMVFRSESKMHFVSNTDSHGISIDANGNVGIGTASPAAKLEVYGNVQNDTTSIANSAAYIRGADVGIAIGQSASSPYGTWVQSQRNSDGVTFPLLLNPSGSNVGIETTSPLHNLQIGTAATNGSYSMMIEGNFANNALASNPRINLIDTNFGITAGKYGSGASDDALGIFAYQGGGRGIVFAHTTAGSGTHLKDMRHDMFIDGGTGNVGIGTNSPAEKLEVAGSIKSTSRAIAGGSTAGITLSYDTSNSIGLIETWTSKPIGIETAGVRRMTITSAGNATFTGIVGMGSTGIYAGTNAQLNLPGIGIAIKNNKVGSNNNWSYIQNTGTSSQANFDFIVGTGTALTLNHDKTSTFTNSISITGTVTASSDIVAYSDERLKTDVETLDGSKVYDMRGVSFTKNDKKGSGVIAQELEKIAPELVNNDSEFKSVAYGNITGYLIEAIKDLKAEVEELKKQIK